MLKYLHEKCWTWCEVNIMWGRTDKDLREYNIFIFLPQKVFQREVFLSSMAWYCTNINVTFAFCITMSPHLTATLWDCHLFPFDIVLVNCASSVLWDICHWTFLIGFLCPWLPDTGNCGKIQSGAEWQKHDGSGGWPSAVSLPARKKRKRKMFKKIILTAPKKIRLRPRIKPETFNVHFANSFPPGSLTSSTVHR